jgi:hypothetical protein
MGVLCSLHDYESRTEEQRVFLLKNWRKRGKNSSTVIEIVINEFPDVLPPRRQEIY